MNGAPMNTLLKMREADPETGEVSIVEIRSNEDRVTMFINHPCTSFSREEVIEIIAALTNWIRQ